MGGFGQERDVLGSAPCRSLCDLCDQVALCEGRPGGRGGGEEVGQSACKSNGQTDLPNTKSQAWQRCLMKYGSNFSSQGIKNAAMRFEN